MPTEFFLSSDPSAIVEHTKKVMYLEDDDIAHIDFDFLIHSIGSMVGPVRWLANSDWKPEWVAGGKP